MKHVLYYGGAALVVFGVWEIYRPLGIIVAGLVLFAVSLLMDRSEAAAATKGQNEPD